MRILILGGRNEADYVIRSFKKGGNSLLVINGDKATAKFLSESNDVDVVNSDPLKMYTYEELDMEGIDLVISLLDRDVDNFVACSLAKEKFGVRKAICSVNNPDNVAVFHKLGIDSPVSSTYLLTERIHDESDIDSLFKTLSLENDKLAIIEFRVKRSSYCAGKAIKNLGFPSVANICCLYRDPEVIIPRGDTVIKKDDKLVVACDPKDKEIVMDFLKKEKHED